MIYWVIKVTRMRRYDAIVLKFLVIVNKTWEKIKKMYMGRIKNNWVFQERMGK